MNADSPLRTLSLALWAHNTCTLHYRELMPGSSNEKGLKWSGSYSEKYVEDCTALLDIQRLLLLQKHIGLIMENEDFKYFLIIP